MVVLFWAQYRRTTDCSCLQLSEPLLAAMLPATAPQLAHHSATALAQRLHHGEQNAVLLAVAGTSQQQATRDGEAHWSTILGRT